MTLYDIIFYFFMVLAGLSALAILLSKNVFKAALFLLICLLSVAALYLFAFAEFVAVAQVLIYAGGVVILIIFGIMLTSRISSTALKVENSHIFPGILASLALLVLLTRFLSFPFRDMVLNEINGNSIVRTGLNLMSAYVLPFELAGILLLAALIGAAITSTAQDKPRS